MKNLLLTILVVAGAIAGVCYHKGISPAKLKEIARTELDKIFNGRPPKDIARSVAGGAVEFIGETASALDSVIPGMDDIEDARDSLKTLKERLKKRELAIMEENARLSPYFNEAVRAKKAYDRAVKEAERLLAQYGHTDSRVAKSHHDLAVLKDRLATANGKHRDWKSRNASRLKDVDADAEVIELRRRIIELGGRL